MAGRHEHSYEKIHLQFKNPSVISATGGSMMSMPKLKAS